MRVTKEFASRIHQDDASDPLLRQFYQRQKRKRMFVVLCKSLDEKNLIRFLGCYIKYFGRALLLVTDKCH